MTALLAIGGPDRRRLLAASALMASDQDGEALAAVRATSRLLAAHGVGLRDVFTAALERVLAPLPFEVKPMVEHEELARRILAYPEYLTDWERNFLTCIAGERTLTSRQDHWLRKIAHAFETKRRGS